LLEASPVNKVQTAVQRISNEQSVFLSHSKVGSAGSGIIQIGQSMRSGLLVLLEQDTDMVSVILMDVEAVIVHFARR
jgi:hypothetical protein